MWSRRQLLASSLAASAAGLSLPLVAGPGTGRRHLVIVMALGGWDPTFVLDDKLSVSPDQISGPDDGSEPETDDDVETRISYGDLSIVANAHKRPQVTAFFDRWVDPGAELAVPCTVLNGVQVRSIGHRECRARILTGTGSSASPDLGVITATTLAEGLPIPHMDLGGVGLTGPLACCAGTVGRRGQLGMLLDPSQLQAPDGQLPYPRSRLDLGATTAVQDALQARRLRFAERRGVDPISLRRLDDYQEALWRAEALAARSETLSETLSFGDQGSLAAQARTGVQLLTEGVSHTLCLSDLNLLWDTHRRLEDQHLFYDALFGGMDALLDELCLAELLDDTLVVVVSEMGRTPLYNTEGGKDHWPVTSAMVLGAGVDGTRTVQATDDRMDAQPVDLETGEPDPDGQLIGYDSLVAGLMERLDVDPDEWLPGATPYRGF